MKCLSFVLLIALASAAEWAVLLAGSSGYGNYRHQSDVAHMYGVLTDHKYDPDHIITIMYGDLPGNEANPFPGTIYNHPGNNQRNYQEGLVIDYKKDRYGLSSWMMDVPFTMFYGAGGMFGSVAEDGTPEMSFEDEDVINRYEKIYRALIEQNAYFVTDLNQYETSYEMFAAGHALFYDTSLNKVRSFLADMSDDYGIVPVPKYDTNQKEYLSFVNGSTGFVMMVSTEKDPEYVGAILEAMARYNYENVSTKMFEIVTKLQSVRDQDSSEMVEYIIRNRVFDSAYFFDLAVSNVVLEQLKTGKPEISAQLTSAKKTSKTELRGILRKMSKKQK